MISSERRFVYDIDSLRQIASNPTEQNLLNSTVFLRRILTDSAGPSLHKVAKGRDFIPRFRVVDLPKPDAVPHGGQLHSFQIQNPDPSENPALPTKEIGLDDFLGLFLGRTEGVDYTVKQIINYVANVGGGVHHGEPKNKDNAKQIHHTAAEVQIHFYHGEQHYPYPVWLTRSIINIVLEALRPLYERLRV
jgi:hypothetical protein